MTTVAMPRPAINAIFMVTEKTGVDGSDDDDQVDEAAILEAYCRAQIAELPRGPRGLKAAKALLTAIPAAYRLGLPDTTTSARQLFRSLADAGLIAESPSDSDMPSALRLVASVCDLVTQRSQRRWTIWFARACDPDHPLGASIRKAVTPAMLRRPSLSPTVSHTSQLNDLERAHEKEERESLRAELEDMRAKRERVTNESRRAHEEASEARVALMAMKAEVSKLRAQLAEEQKTSDQLRKLRNGERELREYVNDQLEKTKAVLSDIAETVGLEEFNADEPGDLAGNVERVLTAAKTHTTHVASVCAGMLDRYMLRLGVKATMYQMLRKGRTAPQIDRFFEEPSVELLNEFMPHLIKMRADLKKKGVVLPPSVVTVDDLRHKDG